MNNFQRTGSVSNAHVGKDFERKARIYFESCGYEIKENYSASLGFEKVKKDHAFDLGGVDRDGNYFVVECKSHTWTAGTNVPSAKITVWNEAMLYFSLLPQSTRKILFVLKDVSKKNQETLGEYYIRTNKHLIPSGVQIMEFDAIDESVKLIYE